MSGTHMNIDIRLTNYANIYLDPWSLYQRVFGKPLAVASVNTWYPSWDDEAYAERDNREELRRSMDSTPARIKFRYAKNPITINGYSAQVQMSKDEIEEHHAEGLDQYERHQAEGLKKTLNKAVDLDLLQLISNIGAWPNGIAPADWDDHINGNPEFDLRAARQQVIQNSRGTKRPNTLLMSTGRWNAFHQHPLIRQRYDNVTGDARQKMTWFANMLDLPVERCFEVMTFTNTSAKGVPPVFAEAMQDIFWMGYVEPRPGVNEPSAMLNLVPTYYVGNDNGIAISRIDRMSGEPFQDTMTHGIRIAGVQMSKIVQTSAPLGYIMAGI
jgi:hypothetical protein